MNIFGEESECGEELDVGLITERIDSNGPSSLFDELKKSRVYRKESAWRISTLSKDDCTMSWSCLSDFSLAEVSNISVINLAITTEDVYNHLRTSQSWSVKHDGEAREPHGLATPARNGLIEDASYAAVVENFGNEYFGIQVGIRDVEIYLKDVRTFTQSFLGFASAFEEYIDVAPTSFPESERKWRLLKEDMTYLSLNGLTDHTSAVRNSVIDPMTSLLKIYANSRKRMQSRKNSFKDYTRYRVIKDRGNKLDKDSATKGERFIAINDTLEQELPKLSSLTRTLIIACLFIFVQLQLRWQAVWKRMLSTFIGNRGVPIPKDFDEIVTKFAATSQDFTGRVIQQKMPFMGWHPPRNGGRITSHQGGDNESIVIEDHSPPTSQEHQEYQESDNGSLSVDSRVQLRAIAEEDSDDNDHA